MATQEKEYSVTPQGKTYLENKYGVKRRAVESSFASLKESAAKPEAKEDHINLEGPKSLEPEEGSKKAEEEKPQGEEESPHVKTGNAPAKRRASGGGSSSGGCRGGGGGGGGGGGELLWGGFWVCFF